MKKEMLPVNDADRDAVFGAQCRLWQLHAQKYSWRAVAQGLKINVRFVYDFVMYNDVPGNGDNRKKLFLPRVLPSEKHPQKPKIKVGMAGWQSEYFKKGWKK